MQSPASLTPLQILIGRGFVSAVALPITAARVRRAVVNCIMNSLEREKWYEDAGCFGEIECFSEAGFLQLSEQEAILYTIFWPPSGPQLVYMCDRINIMSTSRYGVDSDLARLRAFWDTI